MRFALILLLLFVAGESFAIPDAADPGAATARAREAFVRGTELARSSSWREALDAFEQSYALKRHPVTTYNIAFCERELARYARAWASFSRALEAHAAPDGQELPPDLLYSAKVYRSELEEKLARVSIRVPPGARLTVDGEPIEKPSNQELVELMLDPGAHTFRVSKTVHRATEQVRQLVSGPNETLVLELEPELPPPVGVPKREQPKPESVAPAAPTHDYAWPIVAYGIGAVGIGVGAVFGVRALDEERKLRQLCPDRTCPAEYEPRLETANRDALISTAGFGVGIAGAALGTYLLLTLEPAPEQRQIAPALGLGWVGLTGAF
jgi:hypothetical protein